MSTEVGGTSELNEAELIDEEHQEPRAARPGERPEERTGADHGSLWDIRDVSAYLRIPVSSIYKMTARYARVRIPHIRIGGTLRFRPSDIDRWLTLLTTSNLEALSRMRQKVTRVTHGDDPQTTTRER